MINLPLFKCLLAAISVLRCVDAVAPSTTADVAFLEKMRGRALAVPDDIESSLKDCTALDDEKTCTKEDKKRVEKKCSGGGGRKCRKMCRAKYKKFSTDCKSACCPSFTRCQGKLDQFDKGSSTTLHINCPTGGGKVWGSNPYSQDSAFSTAVAHACSDRPITVSIVNVGCQDSYVGSTKNGVTTRDWGYYCDAYQITYVSG